MGIRQATAIYQVRSLGALGGDCGACLPDRAFAAPGIAGPLKGAAGLAGLAGAGDPCR